MRIDNHLFRTTEIFVAAHILKSQGECMAVVPVVTKIDPAPIKEILEARRQEIEEAEGNSECLGAISSFCLISRLTDKRENIAK